MGAVRDRQHIHRLVEALHGRAIRSEGDIAAVNGLSTKLNTIFTSINSSLNRRGPEAARALAKVALRDPTKQSAT
jgi:hypothetical protein